ncbi:MAG TPA: hypothetical protein VGO04_01585 [Ensifer sp.]|uniref:hypothetical protein n=1 Tax=Ensifer sp. TaxID=1872086 RepID=UPI002E0E6FE5|nr:hypothetical protein [Ensifer sp.]
MTKYHPDRLKLQIQGRGLNTWNWKLLLDGKKLIKSGTVSGSRRNAEVAAQAAIREVSDLDAE